MTECTFGVRRLAAALRIDAARKKPRYFGEGSWPAACATLSANFS